MDPHDCEGSCAEEKRGRGCEACTNPEYFHCEHSGVCLHPDLLCDGHQHCQDGEDEDFDLCYPLYIKKGIVSTSATLKCNSLMYPEIFTVATVCNNVTECYGNTDEPQTCQGSYIDKIGITVIVLFTLAFYVMQRNAFGACLVTSDKCEENTEGFDEEAEYLNLHKQDDFNIKINIYLAMQRYKGNVDKKEEEIKEEMKQNILRLVNFENVYHENDEGEVVCCLHNNLTPELFDLVMGVIDPGFVARKIPSLKKFLVWSDEHKYVIGVRNIWTLISHQLDIFKDSLIALTILTLIGGPNTLLDFPRKFTSVVTFSFSLSIIIPLLLCSIGILTEDPTVMLTPFTTSNWPRLRYFLPIQIIFLSFFNSALLANAYQQNVARRERERGEEVYATLLEARRIKWQHMKFLRTELGLENFYQLPIQICLLLFAFTKTKTTGGLDIFFSTSTFLGIDAKVMFGLSSVWSFKQCVSKHIECIEYEKVFLPSKSKALVFLWGLAATAKRILAVVGFFLPCLGLFDTLHHWRAEQTPFTTRRERAEDGLVMVNDTLDLHGLEEKVFWRELDRTDWTDSEYPQFPPYDLYTGLGLTGYFLSFLLLLFLHLITVLAVKILRVRNMSGSRLDIVRHCLENINIPYPWQDFDLLRGGLEEYKARRGKVHREMFCVMVVNFMFNSLMLLPMVYTGNIYFNYVLHLCKPVHILAHKIHSRHDLLNLTIGPTDEEIISYNRIILLLALWVSLVVGFSVLEMIFYFLYSTKVRMLLISVLCSQNIFVSVPSSSENSSWSQVSTTGTRLMR